MLMRSRRLLALSCLALLLAGCPDTNQRLDFDGDGSEDADDCAPSDPTIFPQAQDTTDNGVDNNCDGVPGIDTDGDSYASEGSGGTDCNDSDGAIHPGATEVPDNEDDEDCDDEVLRCDADADGVLNSHPQCGGTDCDDTDASCQDEADCLDGDLDGVAACKGDCDDTDANEYGGAPELCDGRDNDCDTELPTDEQDLDGDGEMACAGDCDDEDATRWSMATEACNGLDEDCSGAPDPDEVDTDGDGFLACAECDDGADHTYPGAPEEPYDDLDQDCDGADLVDVDGDGFVGNIDENDPDFDCDDEDEDAHPGAADPPFDGLDTNCDDVDGVDADGDGWPYLDTPGEEWQTLLLDCDDSDPALNLDDADGDGSTTCGGDCDDGDPLVEALDLDEDGVTTCGPDGVAETGDEDCDDLEPAVLPGAGEVCDMLDNDCSGAPDADEVDADSDGDPYCSDCDDDAPAEDTLDTDGDGFTTCGLDCVDTDAAVNPLAFDSLGDGVDMNCDGVDGIDSDGDEYPQGVDCDDSDDELNLDDLDGDGASTCGDDCDDDDPTLSPQDADFDGFSTCGGDCDDATYAVNPAAAEVCDLLDNNCDGVQDPLEVDDDADGDAACNDCDDSDDEIDGLDSDGDGYSLCDGDCDDGNMIFNPAALDPVGDGWDTNCDGLDGVDLDNDQFASVSSGGEDCDDSDPSVNPAAPEVTGDGIDQNCDGLDLVDADGDGYGDQAGGGEDCDDTDPSVHPGFWEQAEDGLDSNCDGLDGAELLVVTGTGATDYWGAGIASTCDLDGDGLPDIAASYSGWGPHGSIRILFGPILTGATMASPDAIIEGTSEVPVVDDAVYCPGDLDANGADDLLVRGGDSVLVLEGPFVATSALSGATWATPISGSLQDAVGGDFDGDGVLELVVCAAECLYFDGPFDGVAEEGDATVEVGARQVSSGDINGDGVDDLLVGSSAGGAWAFHGPFSGTLGPDQAAATLIPAATAYEPGIQVGIPGDLNADGFDDLFVVQVADVPDASLGGAVHLIFGPVSGDEYLDLADVTIEVDGAMQMATVCELDGDESWEAIVWATVGDWDVSTPWELPFSVVHGPQTSLVQPTEADVIFTESVSVFPSPEPFHFLSCANLDGLGRPDIVVMVDWLGVIRIFPNPYPP